MLKAVEISKQAHIQLAVERKELRQKKSDELLRRSAIPRRYADASLDKFYPLQFAFYEKSIAFAEGFGKRLETGAGMVIHGDIGTGKTHLACAIANKLREQLRPVMYCTALEAVTRIKSCWSSKEENSEYSVYAQFGEPELLIIDEIGVQIGSDFERMVLTSIADIRSRNCLPTIIISNLPMPEILALLGERMFDRLVGFDADILHMAGRSLRLRAV